MRIHSKFQDYYDSCLGYGIDEQCHYVRQTKEVEDLASGRIKGEANEYDLVRDIKFPRFTYDNDRWNGDRNSKIKECYTRAVMFCGRMYYYLNFKVETKNQYGISAYENIYCYSADDVGKVVAKYGSKKEKKTWEKKDKDKWAKYRRRWGDRDEDRYQLNKDDMARFFENQGFEKPEFMDIHHETGIPVMKLAIAPYSAAGSKLVLNPVLKDFQFFRAVDAFQAFQELSMFISGVLGGQSPKMIEVSNEVKIHKAGFDKHSFRKEKETK